ncbi:hypothetical protein AK812_SmicGene46905, partial [Symbiodinium microadriaticum]
HPWSPCIPQQPRPFPWRHLALSIAQHYHGPSYEGGTGPCVAPAAHALRRHERVQVARLPLHSGRCRAGWCFANFLFGTRNGRPDLRLPDDQ